MLWARFIEHRDQATREELVRRYLPFAKTWRCATAAPRVLRRPAAGRQPRPRQRDRPLRPRPRHPLHRLCLADDPRRTEAPLRDRVWTVRVPRGLHDRMAEVDKATAELTVHLQRRLGRRDRRQARATRPTCSRCWRGTRTGAALARPAGRRRRGRVAGLGVDRRRGRGLRAGPEQAGPGGRAAAARRARAGRSSNCASSTTSPSRRSPSRSATRRCTSRGSCGERSTGSAEGHRTGRRRAAYRLRGEAAMPTTRNSPSSSCSTRTRRPAPRACRRPRAGRGSARGCSAAPAFIGPTLSSTPPGGRGSESDAAVGEALGRRRRSRR